MEQEKLKLQTMADVMKNPTKILLLQVSTFFISFIICAIKYEDFVCLFVCLFVPVCGKGWTILLD